MRQPAMNLGAIKLSQLFNNKGDISQLNHNDLKLITASLAPVIGLCNQFSNSKHPNPDLLNKIANFIFKWKQDLQDSSNQAQSTDEDMVDLAKNLGEETYRDQRNHRPAKSKIPTTQVKFWKDHFVHPTVETLTELSEVLKSEAYKTYPKTNKLNPIITEWIGNFTALDSQLAKYIKAYPDPNQEQNKIDPDPILARIMKPEPEKGDRG